MSLWQHQTDTPLFPDVIWSRPETKHGAGKLLIVGGSAGNMARLAKTYAEAEAAGAGTIHLLVPDALAKVTKHIPNIQYAPSNPSGGFGRKALAELLVASELMDGVLLAGDMGKNSETSLLLESYLKEYTRLLIIASEAVVSFACGYKTLLERPETILALTMNQLRDLVMELKFEQAVTSTTGKPELYT